MHPAALEGEMLVLPGKKKKFDRNARVLVDALIDGMASARYVMMPTVTMPRAKRPSQKLSDERANDRVVRSITRTCLGLAGRE